MTDEKLNWHLSAYAVPLPEDFHAIQKQANLECPSSIGAFPKSPATEEDYPMDGMDLGI